MKRLYIIAISLFLLNSCGTILDSSRILGKWKLESADFYTYNEELDSYKKISGGDSISDSDIPAYWAFIDRDHSGYVINFLSDTFDILYDYNENTETGTNYLKNNEWLADNTDNSMTFDVKTTNSSSNNIWQKGFKIKNYWPLSTPTTLEITLIAADINVTSIYVPTSTGHIDAVKMKGIFTKINN